MKKSRFTESQIVFALKLSEMKVKVDEEVRKIGSGEATVTIGRRNSEDWV